MKIPIHIHSIFISPEHDFKGRHGKPRKHNSVQSCDSVECVAKMGMRGDRYFGFKEDYKGQITFFDKALIDDLKVEFDQPDLDPSVIRRNVMVAGVDLNGLIGKEFTIGEVRFVGTEEAAPCYWMNDVVADGAEAFMKGRGGLRARILESGHLSVGEFECLVH